MPRRFLKHQPASCAGYTLAEVSMVLLVLLVITAFALPGFNSISRRVDSETALNQAVAQLRRGRELAITQRRNIEVHFADSRRIELVRIEIPTGSTTLSAVTLEGGSGFRLFDDLPDTPDSFGNATAVDFGTAQQVTFLSDGTLVNETGDPVNGSIFLGLEGHPETARAVTIIGSTGRVRGYRWTGKEWVH